MRMKENFRVDLHILDHADTIKNDIKEYNPTLHKHHFKCSIDTSQLIVKGYDTKDKINKVMRALLDEITNTEYEFRVKTRTYTDRNGNKKEYYSTKRFNLKDNVLAAYHNRSFNSDVEFDNIEPHFHFLFSNREMGRSFYHLKKHLQERASEHDLIFHFAEDKEHGTNKYKGLMQKCSNFSWWTQKMNNKVFSNYVNRKSEDMTNNLDLLLEYTQKTGNLQFYIKVMNNLKNRLLNNNLSFEYRGNDISKLYPIPLNEQMSETLEAIARKDKRAIERLNDRDNFLSRDYIKHCNGFQSTIIGELEARGYNLEAMEFDYCGMQAREKSKKERPFGTFNEAVKKDLHEALKYSRNESELKLFLERIGYEDIGFKSKNVNGKRQNIGFKFTFKGKEYSVYYNQIGATWSEITKHLMNPQKLPLQESVFASNLANLKFFDSYQNKIFKQIYDIDADMDLSKYFIKKESDHIIITSKDSKIIDSNQRIEAEYTDDEEIKLMAQMLINKGWTDFEKLEFNDSDEEFIRKLKSEMDSYNY